MPLTVAPREESGSVFSVLSHFEAENSSNAPLGLLKTESVLVLSAPLCAVSRPLAALNGLCWACSGASVSVLCQGPKVEADLFSQVLLLSSPC